MIGLACLTLSLHLTSVHFGENAHLYNDENFGVGVNCENWHVGAYRNSVYETSVYFGRSVVWCQREICVGGLAGVVSGYTSQVLPVALPLVSYGKEWKLNVIGAPSWKDVPGFLGLSLEIPLKGQVWR